MCEFWDFPLIGLYMARRCKQMDIEVDKDANEYFIKQVEQLPRNSSCERLYLRVHQDIELKTTMPHLCK